MRNLSQKKGLNYNDFPNIKKQKTEEEDNKIDMVTFNIGMKLTSTQKKLMNTILKVYNTTYNWCSWLVSEKNIKPSYVKLNKYVACAHQKNVINKFGNDIIPQFAQWLFTEETKGLTAVRVYASYKFVMNYKTAKSHRKKTINIKFKDMINPLNGSFGLTKMYFKLIDIPGSEKKKKFQCLTNFFKSNKVSPLIKLSRRSKKMPPLNHSIEFTKRPNGKWVLAIPCKPEYIRKDIANKSPDAMCGIDPGCRTFLTVFDETNQRVL